MSKAADGVFLSTTSCFPVDKLTISAYFEHQNREKPLPDGLVDMVHLVISFQTFGTDSPTFSWLTSPEWLNGISLLFREPSQKKNTNVNVKSTNFWFAVFFFEQKLNGGRWWSNQVAFFDLDGLEPSMLKWKSDVRGPTLGGGNYDDLGRWLRSGIFSYMDAINLW